MNEYTRRAVGALGLGLLGACVSGSIQAGDPQTQSALVDYRLGPGDVVRIAVFNEERLSGQFQVGGAGSIAYPLVGDVPASGKTVPELVTSLTEILQDGFVRQPRITVEVVTYRPFYLMGEVGAPGTYPYTPGITVVNAVAAAGGFTYRATRSRVFIKHAEDAGERDYPLTSTTPIRPGDTIRIPERRF
ncbi:MAG: polysaccharide export protein [Hyphomonadaceae bacterium]|nr:polysaccharide export protein [Hyphomonadaceae bacterium]MBY0565250.1 polysaccharide export protein [Hyphomonadaceae bacterium]